MKSAFRRLSRVRTLTGSTNWYLSDDCLLAAKRVMYSVEYRRFYLRDLQFVIVFRSGWWLWRLIVPAALFGALGLVFGQWVNSTFGYIVGGVGLAWAALELALGPTAKSRIRITGATIDLPLVMRTRRAGKVLAKIDSAVRAARVTNEQSPMVQPGESSIPPSSEASQAASTIAATQTNAS